MSQTDIQYFMQSLADLHEKFKQKHYKLTPLDHNATTNLVEQLYAKLITTPAESPTIESKVIPQPKVVETPVAPVTVPTHTPTNQPSVTTAQELNAEIDAVFNPPAAESQSISVAKPNQAFQLGINEKIMFAKELFDDDANALAESIRQLKSFEKPDDAYHFFDNKLAPFLLDEGKDEEILDEYRSIIQRIYS